ANITIDKRPVRQFDSSTEPGVVLIPSVSSLLIESERKALAYAISDECMTQHNWQYTKMGQVKDVELGTEIFPRGFVTGIRKLLGEVDSNG
ncbi:gamma-mobile-trio protein GmtX, partial [Aeromonas caviae]